MSDGFSLENVRSDETTFSIFSLWIGLLGFAVGYGVRSVIAGEPLSSQWFPLVALGTGIASILLLGLSNGGE